MPKPAVKQTGPFLGPLAETKFAAVWHSNMGYRTVTVLSAPYNPRIEDAIADAAARMAIPDGARFEVIVRPVKE